MKASNILPAITAGVIGLIAVLSCSTTVWDELPSPIASFITTYFPDGEVSTYSESNDIYTVNIKNGSTLTFDEKYRWISINGNGEILPQILLYDQLPDRLYKYIEEMNLANGVYRLSRTDREYKVEFHDSYVTYDVATGQVTYPSAS